MNFHRAYSPLILITQILAAAIYLKIYLGWMCQTLAVLVSFPDPMHGEEGSGRNAISELSPCQDPGVAIQIRWLLVTSCST